MTPSEATTAGAPPEPPANAVSARARHPHTGFPGPGQAVDARFRTGGCGWLHLAWSPPCARPGEAISDTFEGPAPGRTTSSGTKRAATVRRIGPAAPGSRSPQPANLPKAFRGRTAVALWLRILHGPTRLKSRCGLPQPEGSDGSNWPIFLQTGVLRSVTAGRSSTSRGPQPGETASPDAHKGPGRPKIVDCYV